MHISCDTLVVGAGPAGSAAARALAPSQRVILIDKATFPRYKTCGGGLLSRAASFAGIDLSPVIETEFRQLELSLLDVRLRFISRRADPIVRMTMRSSLDAALLAAAIRAGADFQPATSLLRLSQFRDHIVAVTTEGEISARYLIAADGANSAGARLAGWPRHTHLAPALEWETHVPPAQLARFSAAARFDFDIPPDGYAWVFPKSAHLSIGVASARGNCLDLNAACTRYLRLLELTPTAIEKHGYVIPTRPRPEGFSRGRVLLAGDAAGLTDPITLEGISHALLSGKLAAEAILSADTPDRARRHYAAALETHILADLRPAARYARLLYAHPALRNALFRLNGQRFVEAMTEIVSGNRRYRDLFTGPHSFLKLFRR
jgi:geranylgeranyl reductase family protein